MSDIETLKSNRVIPILITVLLISIPVKARYSGGTGESNDPYQITTAEDIIDLRNETNDYDKHFILAADIDLEDYVFDEAVIAPIHVSGPITPFFTGVFDGNNHTISHLVIKGQYSLGLFGKLEQSGIIKNLGVIDVNIVSSAFNIGGLAGLNNGIIQQCYCTGIISGDSDVGGLVGYNLCNITNCYSAVNVNANTNAGGLVGFNDGNITNSYSTNIVTSLNSAGGLAAINTGTVIYCYSSAILSCDNLLGGGLVGANHTSLADRGNAYSCFWDVETSGKSNSAGGTGKTTSEMQIKSTFTNAGWDYVGETVNGPNDVWKIVEGITYPILSWQKYSGGTGEPNNPYKIAEPNDWEELMNASADRDKNFIMMADIDLNDVSLMPIDTFAGVFDGNNYVIYNVDINMPESDYIGLFRNIDIKGKIYNINATNVTITGRYYVGGLAGINNGIISNCCINSSVTGKEKVGGLVGKTTGSISLCHSSGTVEGIIYIGGLIGTNSSGSVTKSYNASTVRTSELFIESNMGGLVGYNGAKIIQSYNTGTVIDNIPGNAFIGGLVGQNHGSVVNSYNSGFVSGFGAVGGLAGHNDGDLHFCYNISDVSGDLTVGGLVGWNRGNITSCYNTGQIIGNHEVGGLAGDNMFGIISNCYSTNSVRGEDKVGGLVGTNTSPILKYGTINKSFWDMQISDLYHGVGDMDTDPNGVIGKTTSEMQIRNTFTDIGWDFIGETENGPNDIWWILEGVDYPRLWWQLPEDDFNDCSAAPLWFPYELEPELAHLEEINGRLEVYTAGAMEDIDSIYAPYNWGLDANKPFAVQVDFHFSKTGVGDGRINLGLVPSLDPSAMKWAEFEAGTFDENPFYLYEIRDGEFVQEEVCDRIPENGTLYISYDPNLDVLYFSSIDYDKDNAIWTVSGLIHDTWQTDLIYIILSGGSEDGLALTGQDAWLDNFKIAKGKIRQ